MTKLVSKIFNQLSVNCIFMVSIKLLTNYSHTFITQGPIQYVYQETGTY